MFVNRQKRIDEISTILNEFKERFGEKIVFKENSESLIIDFYESILEGLVKRHIYKNIENRLFFLSSTIELSIIAVQPIISVNRNEEKEKIKYLNSKLAFLTACNFIFGMHSENELNKISQIKEGKILDFINEHIEWLNGINFSYNLPIHSNTETLRLFFEIIESNNNRIENKKNTTPNKA